jgi:hypothetical protein
MMSLLRPGHNGSLLPTGRAKERDWLTTFACHIVLRPRGRAWRSAATTLLNEATNMADPSEAHPLPFTQHHMQSLVRYADAMDNASTRDWGMNISGPHTEEVRAVALRISQFSAEGRGTFSESDVRLLSEIGDGLVRGATPLLAHPDVVPEQKAHAQFRLGLGNAILETRDRVQQHVKA